MREHQSYYSLKQTNNPFTSKITCVNEHLYNFKLKKLSTSNYNISIKLAKRFFLGKYLILIVMFNLVVKLYIMQPNFSFLLIKFW